MLDRGLFSQENSSKMETRLYLCCCNVKKHKYNLVSLLKLLPYKNRPLSNMVTSCLCNSSVCHIRGNIRSGNAPLGGKTWNPLLANYLTWVQVLVCAYFQYSHKRDRSTLEGEYSQGEGLAPATLRQGSAVDPVWLIYIIEL